jgi:hypothetical protein
MQYDVLGLFKFEVNVIRFDASVSPSDVTMPA